MIRNNFFRIYGDHILCVSMYVQGVYCKYSSNYNRASDACVCQSISRTADVTVTKIAGYVRVRILMNR